MTIRERADERTPHNVNDLMSQAAEALADRDVEVLEHLQRVSANWMQDNESAAAQLSMLDAMIDALYSLEELEEVDG